MTIIYAKRRWTGKHSISPEFLQEIKIERREESCVGDRDGNITGEQCKQITGCVSAFQCGWKENQHLSGIPVLRFTTQMLRTRIDVNVQVHQSVGISLVEFRTAHTHWHPCTRIGVPESRFCYGVLEHVHQHLNIRNFVQNEQ